MEERNLRGLDAGRAFTRKVMRLCSQTPDTRETEVIAEALEDCGRLRHAGHQIGGRDLGLGKETEESALYEGVRLQSFVARLKRLAQYGLGPAQIRARSLNDAHVRNQIDTCRVVRR